VIDSELASLCEHGFQRRKISMNVIQCRNSHDRPQAKFTAVTNLCTEIEGSFGAPRERSGFGVQLGSYDEAWGRR
jgi:hypothetical protein